MNSDNENLVDEITVWINQLEQQPERSTQAIWEKYYSKLVNHARRKLKSLPRRHVDEEDVASDAMNSLFCGMREGRFPNLNDRDDLWKLLLTITARKAGKEIRSNMAQKRGGGMTRGESVFLKPGGEVNPGLASNAIAADPTPEFAVDVVRECESLLGDLDDEVLREIAIMKLEGFTNDEIGEKLQCATRSVERKLKRIRGVWAPSDQASE